MVISSELKPKVLRKSARADKGNGSESLDKWREIRKKNRAGSRKMQILTLYPDLIPNIVHFVPQVKKFPKKIRTKKEKTRRILCPSVFCLIYVEEASDRFLISGFPVSLFSGQTHFRSSCLLADLSILYALAFRALFSLLPHFCFCFLFSRQESPFSLSIFVFRFAAFRS